MTTIIPHHDRSGATEWWGSEQRVARPRISDEDRTLPPLDLFEAIKRQFGWTLGEFVKQFSQAGLSLFGSGWVWLSADGEGKLVITQEPNSSNPIRRGLTPLLTIDVWEHAYYLDYQNRRAEYLEKIWQAIYWDVPTERYRKAL